MQFYFPLEAKSQAIHLQKRQQHTEQTFFLRCTIVKVIFYFAEAETSSSEDSDERLIDKDHS